MTHTAPTARSLIALIPMIVATMMIGRPAGAHTETTKPHLGGHTTIPLPHEAYDRLDYTLAYHVFLNAHHVRKACGVALVAVHNRPTNLLWRERLAKTALWLGHERLALREMSYLALHGEVRYLKPALALASALSAFTKLTQLVALKLKHHPGSPALIQEMSALYQLQGHPHRAIAWLQSAMKKEPRRRYLWEIIVLENSLGAQRQELAALRAYRQRYGASPRTLLTEASLFYRSGHTARAFRLLARHGRHIAPTHFAYYHTLGALAWLQQDFPVALKAARALYAQGTATSGDLTHMILLEGRTHPRTSYLMATVGWRRYHRPFFFFAMLSIAEQQRSRALLAKTFAGLTAKDRARLSGNPYFWTGYAHDWAIQGQYTRAESTYRSALTLFPQDSTILASYLWFLVDTGEARTLASSLQRYTRIVNSSRTLWFPYALCLLDLNNPRMALPYLRALLREHPQDLTLLLPYADALAKDGHAGLAITVRRRAFALLLRAPSDTNPHRTLRRRASFEAEQGTAPATLPLMKRLARDPRTDADHDVVLAYALSHDDYSLAHLELKSYGPRGRKPPWARFAIALADRNGTALRTLLAHHSLTLPRSDRVTAAERLGEPERAASLAFAGLSNSRSDWALAHQYRRLLLSQSDRIGGRLQYLKSAGFSAVMERLSVRHVLTPRIWIVAQANNNLITQTNALLIGAIPRFDRSEQVMLGLLSASGIYHLTAGDRFAVTRFPYARASWQSTLWAHSTQKIRVYYQTRAYDLPSLYIGGTKSGASLSDSDTLTARDSLDARASYRDLTAQGGGSLATGTQFALHYDHKLRLEYPDITVGTGLSMAHYQGAQNLPSQLLPLLPQGTTGIGFFVPQSYVQGGVDVHFGEDYLRHYSPDCRPFLDLDVFENSVTHAGYDLTIGIATPILGPDHLAVYYTRGQGGVGIENRVQYVGIRYAYDLKP
ncbi:MAG: tetratricopeptide repeat protein [Acidiferrobacter sp.]